MSISPSVIFLRQILPSHISVPQHFVFFCVHFKNGIVTGLAVQDASRHDASSILSSTEGPSTESPNISFYEMHEAKCLANNRPSSDGSRDDVNPSFSDVGSSQVSQPDRTLESINRNKSVAATSGRQSFRDNPSIATFPSNLNVDQSRRLQSSQIAAVSSTGAVSSIRSGQKEKEVPAIPALPVPITMASPLPPMP